MRICVQWLGSWPSALRDCEKWLFNTTLFQCEQVWWMGNWILHQIESNQLRRWGSWQWNICPVWTCVIKSRKHTFHSSIAAFGFHYNLYCQIVSLNIPFSVISVIHLCDCFFPQCRQWLCYWLQEVNVLDKNGWTPLHFAAFQGRLSCMQLLLRWGCLPDDTENTGCTAGI